MEKKRLASIQTYITQTPGKISKKKIKGAPILKLAMNGKQSKVYPKICNIILHIKASKK